MNDTLKDETIRYAGLRRRFVALAIDCCILSFFFFPITRIVKGEWIMDQSDHLWASGWFITDPLCIIFLAVIVLYFIIFEGFWSATIGKKAVGLKIVLTDGKKSGIVHAFVRNLLRIVDALPAFNILGIVLILSSPEKARFGDRVAGTRVIVKR